MKIKYGYISVFSFAFLVFVLYFNTAKKENDRDKYEDFLVSAYRKLPPPEEEQSEEVPEQTRPDLAAIQNYFMTLDPNLKRVPTERLKTAYLQTKSISQLKSGTEFGSDITWQEVPSNMAGRTRAFMIDPNDLSGNKAWVGSVTGGLWVNNNFKDAGSSWMPVNSFWSNLVVSCIISDPNNPLTFYVGTGEAQTAFTIYRESSGVGAGIWKTTDGGASWEQIPSTENFKYITDMAIRNENGSSVIYACVTSGVYQGENHESIPSDGLYRSINNGISWEQVLPNIAGENKPYTPADIEITSDNGRIFIGSMRDIQDNGGGTILFSDEGTKGSWSVYNDYVDVIESSYKYNIPGRVVLASAPSNPNVIYALMDVAYIDPEDGFKHSRCQYILKSAVKGNAWNIVNSPTNEDWAYLGWHALAIAIDPNNENIIFIGGLDVHKSDNGGLNWHKISDWATSTTSSRYVHADIHKILFLGNSSDEVVVTTDGGIFYSATASQFLPGFEQKNNNYNSLQFYTCAMDPRAGTNIFVGGLQDNGTVRYNGIPISGTVDGGDGAFCFIDQDEPNTLITSIYYNRYYFFTNGNYNYPTAQSAQYYNTGIFISPADYDNRLNILYANATTFLNQHTNQLLRVSGIPSHPVEQLISISSEVKVPFSNITVSEHSPVNTTTLFAGTQSGRLFKVENAQDIPESIEIGSPDFPTANISGIAIGSTEDTLLVTFSNYGVSSVWQTYDGGISWSEKEGNLPDMPIRWVVYHPFDADKAFLATEVGVWGTDQLSQENPEWYPLSNGMPNVRVDMLRLRKSDQTMLAATHGRGLAYTAISQVGINEPDISNEILKIYPNPASNFLNLSIENTIARKFKLSIYDPAGRLIFTEEKNNLNGTYYKTLDLNSWPKGTLMINLLIDGHSISRKFIHE